MTPALASSAVESRELSGVIPDDETILLMIRPSPWFIVSTSMRAVPAAAAAGAVLVVASLDPSIPWDFRGALFASTAIVLARAGWQSIDWFMRLYILTDRRIVVRRGVVAEIFECTLGEVAGIGQPRRWGERLGGTGSLAIIRGPSRKSRRTRGTKLARSSNDVQMQAKSGEIRRAQPRVRVDHPLEWSVIRDAEVVRRAILGAVSRYR